MKEFYRNNSWWIALLVIYGGAYINGLKGFLVSLVGVFILTPVIWKQRKELMGSHPLYDWDIVIDHSDGLMEDMIVTGEPDLAAAVSEAEKRMEPVRIQGRDFFNPVLISVKRKWILNEEKLMCPTPQASSTLTGTEE